MGCERFFGLPGYVSESRRNMLGVRNYERIAMVSHILQYLYVDPKWVAQHHILHDKTKPKHGNFSGLMNLSSVD